MDYPAHGKIINNFRWGEIIYDKNGWKLTNNPIAWGSSNPKVIVLGFSKGDTQVDQIDKSDINDVLFKGMRNNLTKMLQILGLLEENEHLNEKISGEEKEFHFGSLIRFSVSKIDKDKGIFVNSGSDIIGEFTRNGEIREFLMKHFRDFFNDFPSRTKLFIMLGNDDRYINFCKDLMCKFHDDIKQINGVSYGNNKVTFVHVIHPSGLSGIHLKNWLTSKEGKQAQKREEAIKIVNSVLK